MSGPRFAPRDYAEDVTGFGRVPQLRWVSPRSGAERTFLRAAQLQHQYVLRIRARMDARGMSAKQYAARTGTSYARLMRLLRGEVSLRLEDIALPVPVSGRTCPPPSEHVAAQFAVAAFATSSPSWLCSPCSTEIAALRA